MVCLFFSWCLVRVVVGGVRGLVVGWWYALRAFACNVGFRVAKRPDAQVVAGRLATLAPRLA